MSTNVRILPDYLNEAIIIALFVIFVKLLIVFLISKFQGASFREALVYGVGMCVKGADNIIVLAIAMSVGVLFDKTELFLAALFVVMFISMIFATITMRLLLPKKKSVRR